MLQQIEYRLGIVLTSMANLKVEQARLQAEYDELTQRKEQIINPPSPPPPPPPTSIEEEKRLKYNARQREYQAKRRAEGYVYKPKDRAKYNAYHREYERKRRKRLSAEKEKLKPPKLSMEEILRQPTTQITERRNGITTQIKEHHQ
jgi:hypothetical protein